MLLANIAKDSAVRRAALQGKEYVQQLAGDTGPHGAISDRENNALGFKFYDQAEGNKEVFKELVKANLVERFSRENKDKGGEVDVPRAPSEPDERIDKMTGMPYHLQAGIAFRDEEDPIKRLGLAGGGTTSSMQRLGFEKGGFLKKLVSGLESTSKVMDSRQLALAKKVGFTEENINAAKAFGESYGDNINTQDGGKGDAARHMMFGWAAAQTNNPDTALKAINFRDWVTGIPFGEGVKGVQADVHNNKLGFSWGGASLEEAQEQMHTAIEEREAKYR
jgi:hypothetical protein